MKGEISAIATVATSNVWKTIGNDIKQQVIEVIGKENAVNQQIGTVIGKLNDFGATQLANELKNRIAQHNQTTE